MITITKWPGGLDRVRGVRRRVSRTALVAWLSLSWPAHGEHHPGWSPATFADDSRARGTVVESVEALGLDVDEHVESIEQALRPWRTLAGVWHTTRRSTPEAPRLRVVLWLSRPVTVAEHARLVAWAETEAQDAGGYPLCSAVRNPTRFWFCPCDSSETGELTGDVLDVDAVLSIVPEQPAEPERREPPRERVPVEPGHGRPGDDYLQRGSIVDLLERHGWHRVRRGDPSRARQDHWCRPGKRAGTSATWDGVHFYVHSSNAQPLEVQTSYDLLGLYAALEHHGDLRAAVRELGRQGYGEQRPAHHDAPDVEATWSGIPDDDEPDDSVPEACEFEPGIGDELHDVGEDIRAIAERIARPVTESPYVSLWRPVELEVFITRPPARKWLLRHPTDDGPPGTGDGLLPRGKVGVLTSAGGAGKTMVLVSLALSVVTGRPWLGHFEVDWQARAGKILLVLLEEDVEETERRLYNAAEAMGLDPGEHARAAEQIITLPMAGVAAPLVDAEARETPHLTALRRKLTDEAGPNGWSLVVLDPLARLGAADSEGSNAAATRLVQALESLVDAPGRPGVLASHHSSKEARRTGKADARGVTGLTDAMRWHATLQADRGAVLLALEKSNYGVPMPEPLRLTRGQHGILRVPTTDELRGEQVAEEHRAVDQLEGDIGLVVAAVAREPSGLPSADTIAQAAGIRAGRGRAAVAAALGRGLLERVGTARERRIVAVNHNAASQEMDNSWS